MLQKWKNRDALKSTMIVTSCVRLSENLVLLNEPVCDGRFRADSICNNPIPEWQSRIGMRGSFYERSVSGCTTVFGIDFFARIFGPTRAWSRAWREVRTCMSSRQRRWLDDSIPSARLFRIQIRNPSKSRPMTCTWHVQCTSTGGSMPMVPRTGSHCLMGDIYSIIIII